MCFVRLTTAEPNKDNLQTHLNAIKTLLKMSGEKNSINVDICTPLGRSLFR